MATTEIAERLIVERGLDVGNRAVRAGMLASVGSALRPQRGRGVVRTVRKVGKSVLWELAE